MAKMLLFGKYKGRTIAEVLAGDPEYLRWLCSQDEFRSNFKDTYQDIINCVEDLIDAPERKVVRARFQDVDFCRRFLRTSGHEPILLHELEVRHAKAFGEIDDRLRDLKETTSKAKNYIDDPHHQAWAQTNGIFLDPVDRERQIAGFEQMIAALHNLRKRIPSQIEVPEPKISCRFEQQEFDVIMRASIRYPWESDLRKNYLGPQDGGIKSTVAIKIRWTVGDNYPATIRRIGENRNVFSGMNRGANPIADHVVLLVGRYNGRTRGRFVGEAAAADIKVVFAADLETPSPVDAGATPPPLEVAGGRPRGATTDTTDGGSFL
jgi:Exodeoxyribonuclease X-like C-terminal